MMNKGNVWAWNFVAIYFLIYYIFFQVFIYFFPSFSDVGMLQCLVYISDVGMLQCLVYRLLCSYAKLL